MKGLDWIRSQAERVAGWARQRGQLRDSKQRIADAVASQERRLKDKREESRVLSQEARNAVSNRMGATDELRATLQVTLDRVSHRSLRDARR